MADLTRLDPYDAGRNGGVGAGESVARHGAVAHRLREAARLRPRIGLGAELGACAEALRGFEGLPHRHRTVHEAAGVRWVDDSKATNVDAVKRALECFDRRVILIMGGRNKKGDFTLLKALVRQHVKTLVAMGEARDEIVTALAIAGDLTFHPGRDTLTNEQGEEVRLEEPAGLEMPPAGFAVEEVRDQEDSFLVTARRA